MRSVTTPKLAKQFSPALAAALTVVVVLLLFASRGTASAQQLQRVADGFRQPVELLSPRDGSGRLFVVEKPGTVALLLPGETTPRRYLDLSDRVGTGGEQGLLGLAFHPDFGENGRFFVSYTDRSGDSRVAELWAEPSATEADPATAVIVYQADQPFGNHNGGQLAFGPDGHLYYGLGDGGSSGDPQDHGQRLSSPLGKMLRFDVDAAGPGALGVPADNPFVGQQGVLPEIWAYGLRNPWRFSFDPVSGELWIADVGQNRQEEINLQPADSRGGENYGWRLVEGEVCFQPDSGCDLDAYVRPVHVYGRDQGVSVSGGVVPHGPAAPSLRGRYLFADFGSSRVWALDREGEGYRATELFRAPGPVAGFGLDEALDAYLLDFGAGVLYRIVD